MTDFDTWLSQLEAWDGSAATCPTRDAHRFFAPYERCEVCDWRWTEPDRPERQLVSYAHQQVLYDHYADCLAEYRAYLDRVS